ncbi:MAG: maleylpyruvate isomerase family mycothiol-dependent enzyme [Actinobacteria bacterium]|nr:maleylpyruvate isomerase family mycothiol-dependent enzyme [Actinomycetota bacterium]
MDYDQNVAAADREATAFIDAVAAGPMGESIPSCPAWTMADLAEHVGTFMGWWTAVICEGAGRAKPDHDDGPEPDQLLAWLSKIHGDMVDVLGSSTPDIEIWTWADDKSVAFAGRRIANELGIHRYDAQLARGTQRPLDADLAASIIDEIETIVGINGDLSAVSGETIHLHATDGDGEWVIEMYPHGFRLRREHAKSDLALRGAVSDLALTLYGRPTIATIEEIGDAKALAAWQQVWPW